MNPKYHHSRRINDHEYLICPRSDSMTDNLTTLWRMYPSFSNALENVSLFLEAIEFTFPELTVHLQASSRASSLDCSQL